VVLAEFGFHIDVVQTELGAEQEIGRGIALGVRQDAPAGRRVREAGGEELALLAGTGGVFDREKDRMVGHRILEAVDNPHPDRAGQGLMDHAGIPFGRDAQQGDRILGRGCSGELQGRSPQGALLESGAGPDDVGVRPVAHPPEGSRHSDVVGLDGHGVACRRGGGAADRTSAPDHAEEDGLALDEVALDVFHHHLGGVLILNPSAPAAFAFVIEQIGIAGVGGSGEPDRQDLRSLVDGDLHDVVVDAGDVAHAQQRKSLTVRIRYPFLPGAVFTEGALPGDDPEGDDQALRAGITVDVAHLHAEGLGQGAVDLGAEPAGGRELDQLPRLTGEYSADEGDGGAGELVRAPGKGGGDGDDVGHRRICPHPVLHGGEAAAVGLDRGRAQDTVALRDGKGDRVAGFGVAIGVLDHDSQGYTGFGFFPEDDIGDRLDRGGSAGHGGCSEFDGLDRQSRGGDPDTLLSLPGEGAEGEGGLGQAGGVGDDIDRVPAAEGASAARDLETHRGVGHRIPEGIGHPDQEGLGQGLEDDLLLAVSGDRFKDSRPRGLDVRIENSVLDPRSGGGLRPDLMIARAAGRLENDRGFAGLIGHHRICRCS